MESRGAVASRTACEICAAEVHPRPLRGGGSLTRCGRCGHLGRDLTDAPGGHRDLAYGGEPTLDRLRLDLTYRSVLRAMRGERPHSVFEVGFGSGSMLRRFLDGGAAIAGADPDQLRIGVDPVVMQQGRLFQGGVEEVAPTSGGGLDLVYGIHVLEHVSDPARTLATSFELLRPGGVAQFLTPAGDSDGIDFYGSAWWMLEDPTHVRFFTADSLARAASDAGFVDIEIRRPVLDSLTTDIASAFRRWRPAPGPGGVLASRGVIATGLVSAPLVAAARVLRPTVRPTLHLIARRPALSASPVDDAKHDSGGDRCTAQRRGLARSARLFRAFTLEQTRPDVFYGALAADSVELLSELTQLRGATVLDVGAGPAEFARAFRAAGAQYVPVDHDVSVPSVRDGGLVATAAALPVADGSVDLVFSSNMWEHVQQPEQVGDELMRVLRPGGLLFLSYTNWLSPWGGHETSPWHWFGGERAVRRYTRRHGHPPKNTVDETLFRISVARGLRWAQAHPEVEVLVARPRYLPDAARYLLRVPGLREVLTWNLLLVLRRR